MPITKEHKEFYAVDMTSDWHRPAGYPDGIEQKILSGSLDETARTGNRTRLLRFWPGAFTTVPFIHDYWEEVYLVSGDFVVGDASTRNDATSFGLNTYVCRPPGVYRGPFMSRTGCLLLELHYFEP